MNVFGESVTRWVDSAGTVRQLTWRTGSEDHAQKQQFYYDASGRLRFIFVTRGAVNGTHEEERVYYTADRRVLRRRTKRLSGPGYPFTGAQPIWRPSEWLRGLCSLEL